MFRAPASPPTSQSSSDCGPAGRSEESAADRLREAGEAKAIRDAPVGLSTVHLEDAGDVLLLKRSLPSDRASGATITVGQPLAPVDRAQENLARTFLIAGSLTVAAALFVAFGVAARLSAPLRRMAAVASEVDAGDLSHRMPEGGARGGSPARPVVQSHAGSAGGGVRPPARVRLGRLARAAHAH